MNQMSTSTDAHVPEWVSKFPLLKDVRDDAWLETANRAKEVTLPANYEVFHDGDPCENYIFVVDGATRVYKSFENGREMLLYRLQAGETCSLTTSILLAGGKYTANAMTEAETRAVIIPISIFHDTFDKSKGFRDFVCSTFGGRIRDFIMLLESIATRNVDVRLARYLLENKSEGDTVEASHKVLAFELGTAREVVSRHLKDFEANGWVNLSRKSIQLVNMDKMGQLVSGCMV
ncbi:MAG: Crp/Fnr family transcriptional regulator [Thiotrichales bacterium]|nr:MAG: Crp/Fnr family transcriptional regulator [Thiotrichales bacterium]